MSGLAPTLIIVRVAYGKSVDSVQQVISIHFAEQASQIPRTMTVDIRSRPQNDNLATHIEAGSPEKMDESRMV
ncbi:hypothetical protein PQX77_013200 [Marasmius sp. AFHP31]|nr:hypothetical protein PQX77_013200 [Marasmius sp. AFHP31]